ncbi:hypothetical protein [Halopenitus persicus]|uniref:Uncharacterized protein n=1 Tax=Halopenitus persicus TaxID=1048396 RepID=A0A1H3JZN0_9EURY|nr:hypothetical protein [Halopenitus persicus]SDY45413.1 hypothetical protein SAMN05216564_105202 [Halopenitus persicus]
MSVPEKDGVATLPSFAALDVQAVLANERRGASIQLDEVYFRGQQLAMDAVETTPTLTERRNIAVRSRRFHDQIQLDFDSLTHETLRSASTKYRELLQRLPEVQYLKRQFPGTCFVLPEWLRTPERVNYGARIYFFREEDAPAPDDVLDRNIDAVVADDRAAFERYQGALHGYPECCIEFFSEHERRAKTSPELKAIEPIEEYLDEETLPTDETPPPSIDSIIDGIFETPHVYAFFAREFFPEPSCEQARRRGAAIHDTLSDAHPEPIVKDYFRINAGWSYLMAQATTPEAKSATRPPAGAIGREHLLFFLPLSVMTRQYQRTGK